MDTPVFCIKKKNILFFIFLILILIIISSDFREGNTSLLYTGLMATRALTLRVHSLGRIRYIDYSRCNRNWWTWTDRGTFCCRGRWERQEADVCAEGGLPLQSEDLLLRPARDRQRPEVRSEELQKRHPRWASVICRRWSTRAHRISP